MFKNLEVLLESKGLSYKDYATFLSIAEKTVYNKLNGKTEFTLKEVTKTANYLFPEYKVDYIFNNQNKRRC